MTLLHAAKTAEKILVVFKKINITSVIDVKKNQYICRPEAVTFCFGH